MNKHGQTLVTFVILLPVIFLLIGYIIEISIIGYHKSKINSVTKSIIANCIDECEKDDIILLYDKNDIKIDNVNIYKASGLRVSFTSKVDSFLGSIIGKDSYNIKFDIKEYHENNKIKYEKGS